MKNVKTKDIVVTGDTTLCFINMNNKKPIILKKENSLLDKKLREFCDNKNI